MQVVGVRVFSMLKSSLRSLMSVRRSDGMTEIAGRFVSAATVPREVPPRKPREEVIPRLWCTVGATQKLLERYLKRIYLA